MNATEVIKAPCFTEKTTLAKETLNEVSFIVHPRASKHQIRQAIQTLFDVKVLEVRTSNVRGKQKRLGRFQGRRSDWKKARIRLRQGDRIDYFEGT